MIVLPPTRNNIGCVLKNHGMRMHGGTLVVLRKEVGRCHPR